MGRDAQAEETIGRMLLRQQRRKVSLLKVLGSEETQVAKEMIVPHVGTPWVALYLWSGPTWAWMLMSLSMSSWFLCQVAPGWRSQAHIQQNAACRAQEHIKLSPEASSSHWSPGPSMHWALSKLWKPGLVTGSCNPSTQEAEAGGFP